MTGIRNSRRLWVAAGAACCLAGQARADNLHLVGEARLSGDVRALHENGSVELATPLAPEPLRLSANAVRRVEFSAPEAPPELPTTRIELANGDLLPAAIESLDGPTLVAISPIAGRLEIAREVVKSLHLGIYPERFIYRGSGGLSGWTRHAGDWTFEDGRFVVEGQGRISHPLPPADPFLIRFTLEWRNNPSFQLFFADPLDDSGAPVDRYYLQFNHSGLEIKRESTGRKRYASLGAWARQPAHFAAERIDVEIRVDRRQQLLELFVNGEPEGRMFDPLGSVPLAGGIALVSNANNNTTQSVTRLEVLHWDADGDRHRTEERGNPEHDTLISTHGDRMEGELLEIRAEGESPLFVFKSDFLEAPAEIVEEDISTVFLARGEGGSGGSATADHPFALRLHGGGVLRVASCTFSADRVEANHTLLGPVSLLRGGVTAFERTEPPAAPKS